METAWNRCYTTRSQAPSPFVLMARVSIIPTTTTWTPRRDITETSGRAVPALSHNWSPTTASAHTIRAKTESTLTYSFLLDLLGCKTERVVPLRSKLVIPHPTPHKFSWKWRVLKTSPSMCGSQPGQIPKREFPSTANVWRVTLFRENSLRCHEPGRMEIGWSSSLECRFACKRSMRRTLIRWHWFAGRLLSLVLAICPKSSPAHDYSPQKLPRNLQKIGWCGATAEK